MTTLSAFLYGFDHDNRDVILLRFVLGESQCVVAECVDDGRCRLLSECPDSLDHSLDAEQCLVW